MKVITTFEKTSIWLTKIYNTDSFALYRDVTVVRKFHIKLYVLQFTLCFVCIKYVVFSLLILRKKNELSNRKLLKHFNTNTIKRFRCEFHIIKVY